MCFLANYWGLPVPELSVQTLTIMLFIVKLVTVGVVKVYVDLNKRQRQTQIDLQQFKLSAAEKYATGDAIESALNRLHQRLDDLFKEVHKR